MVEIEIRIEIRIVHVTGREQTRREGGVVGKLNKETNKNVGIPQTRPGNPLLPDILGLFVRLFLRFV